MLSTKPASIGSPLIVKTIGIADVAALAARADASPPTATSTLTRRSTNSLANAGNNP
jgi:hypothetical protein